MEYSTIGSFLVFIFFVVIIYAIMKNENKNFKRKQEMKDFLDNSPITQDKICLSKNLSIDQIDDIIKKDYKDSVLRSKALEYKVEKQIYDRNIRQEISNNEWYASKHIEDIYELFNSDELLPRSYFVERIMKKFNLNEFSAYELILDWRKHGLIGEAFYTRGFYMLKYFGSMNNYSDNMNIISHNEWLKINNITYGVKSKEFILWGNTPSTSNPDLLNFQANEYNYKRNADGIIHKKKLKNIEMTMFLSVRITLSLPKYYRELASNVYKWSNANLSDLSYIITDDVEFDNIINEEFFNINYVENDSVIISNLVKSLTSEKANCEFWDGHEKLNHIYNQICQIDTIVSIGAENAINVLKNYFHLVCEKPIDEIEKVFSMKKIINVDVEHNSNIEDSNKIVRLSLKHYKENISDCISHTFN